MMEIPVKPPWKTPHPFYVPSYCQAPSAASKLRKLTKKEAWWALKFWEPVRDHRGMSQAVVWSFLVRDGVDP